MFIINVSINEFYLPSIKYYVTLNICFSIYILYSYIFFLVYFLDWRDQYKRLQREDYYWSDYDFDYDSIMLYPQYACSINGRKTIEALNGRKIKENKRLSEMDIDKLNNL